MKKIANILGWVMMGIGVLTFIYSLSLFISAMGADSGSYFGIGETVKQITNLQGTLVLFVSLLMFSVGVLLNLASGVPTNIDIQKISGFKDQFAKNIQSNSVNYHSQKQVIEDDFDDILKI